MKETPTYRFIASLVMAVFLVFDIGLPIVVASCPMAEQPMTTCGMCNPEPNATIHKLTAANNTACCATVFAADKNSTEFVQTKSVLFESVKAIAHLPVVFNTQNFLQHILSTQGQELTSKRATDILSFTSSLLI